MSRRGKRVPYDGSFVKPVTAEIGVEIGLMVNVETTCTNNQVNTQELEEQVKDKIVDMFDIDGRDKVLNNICIYVIQ